MNYLENQTYDAVVVGAGLSGLIAARGLQQRHKRVVIVESQPEIGGRVQTDRVDGFLLDRGFQVFLTSYPTAAQELRLPDLQLGVFESGAMIRLNGRFVDIADLWRRPSAILSTVAAGIGSLRDKWLIGRLRAQVIACPLELLLGEFRECSTRDYLEQFGFSSTIVERFFRPFFGGIFLDGNLDVAANVFRYLFRLFSQGYAALPADGMRAIPQQIAAELDEGTICLNRTVVGLDGPHVRLDDGSAIHAKNVILATESSSAARLLGSELRPASRASVCFYYATAGRPPTSKARLMLNGDEADKPVNSVAVLSNAQPRYAPAGQHLISVSCLGAPNIDLVELRQAVEIQLHDWFGEDFAPWRFIRSYSVPWSLPDQSPEGKEQRQSMKTLQQNGVYLAGDYTETGSIEGAIRSGLQAAKSVL